MDGRWSQDNGNHEMNAYVDWEDLVDAQDHGPASFFPVFVEVMKSASGKFTPAIDELFELRSDGRLLIEYNDLRYMDFIRKIEIDENYAEDQVYCFLYLKRKMINQNDIFIVQHVSPSVRVKNFQAGIVDFPVLRVAQEIPVPGEPIVASIDDGIGFLNARFCKQKNSNAGKLKLDFSRYHSIWLQSIENILEPSSSPDGWPMQIGKILDQSKINELLKNGNSEAANYGLINRNLFSQEPEAHRSLDFAFTHGTAIMDCAAGGEPGELDEIELLGVQLPPHSIRDSFGKRFDGYVLQGLRWIMDRALDLGFAQSKAAGHAVTVPLVINISLGSTAGPKDGSGFLEAQIEREISRYKLLGQSEMIVVFSFGNNLRTSQVAYFSLPATKDSVVSTETVDWCILPDDRTASYLEIRAQKYDELSSSSSCNDIKFSIETPYGESSPVEWPAPHTHIDLKLRDEEDVIARIYGEEPEQEGRRNLVVVAVRPTMNLQGEAIAPAGVWRIKFENISPKDLQISVQVQRDDTPGSYRPHGRQSYLDHQEAYNWDDEMLNYSKPSPTGPITREGTHTAQTSGKLRDIRKVGAVYGKNYGSNPDNGVVTLFSSAGSTNDFLSYSDGPTDKAVSDESRLSPGIIASGTYSGSATRISGTSTAAAKVTREWLNYYHNKVVSVST